MLDSSALEFELKSGATFGGNNMITEMLYFVDICIGSQPAVLSFWIMALGLIFFCRYRMWSQDGVEGGII